MYHVLQGHVEFETNLVILQFLANHVQYSAIKVAKNAVLIITAIN